MPEKKTLGRAKRDLKQGKSPSTAAGEFVHEEIDHIREGKHGARSTKQAIAIGLSKARRAGVPLPAPAGQRTSQRTRRAAQRDVEVGQGTRKRRPSAKRRRATTAALKREPRAAASKTALSRHAKATAPKRRAKQARPAGATRRSKSVAPRRGAARSSTTGKASTTRRGRSASTPA